jgi:hypothetical protein
VSQDQPNFDVDDPEWEPPEGRREFERQAALDVLEALDAISDADIREFHELQARHGPMRRRVAAGYAFRPLRAALERIVPEYRRFGLMTPGGYVDSLLLVDPRRLNSLPRDFDVVGMLAEIRQSVLNAAQTRGVEISELLAGIRPGERSTSGGRMPKPTVIVEGRADSSRVDGRELPRLTSAQFDVVKALQKAGERGLTGDELVDKSGHGGAVNTLKRLARTSEEWRELICLPGSPGHRYRLSRELTKIAEKLYRH